MSLYLQGEEGMLILALTSDFIGNENDFTMNMRILVGGSEESDQTNNNQSLQFIVDSQSGISVEL